MRKIGTVLLGCGSYVPEQVLTNETLTTLVDTSDEWIVQRTGIQQRHMAVQQSTAELAIPAAQRAIADAGIQSNEIDLIIACTATPDSFTPTLSCRIQAAIQADNAFAFDLSAACSGFVYAVDAADCYIRAGRAKTVLVVCAETLSRIVDYTDRTTCCLFGDGAGAAVFQYSENEEGILQTYMRADGSRGDALFAQALPKEDPLKERSSTRHFLQMNGKEVFRFTGRAVPEAIDHVLHQADMKPEEIEWIIPHQANLRIVDMICRRYGLDKKQVYVNIQQYGNTSSASIPIALDEMKRKGMLRKGQYVILTGFGGGLTYGAVLMRL